MNLKTIMTTDPSLFESCPKIAVSILPLFQKYPENEWDECSSHPIHFQDSLSNSVLTELEKKNN